MNSPHKTMPRNPRVSLISLGCAKNLVDSEMMSGLLRQEGFPLTPHADRADVIVVNTCAFIQEATQEAIDHLFAAVRLKRTGSVTGVIAAGCLPQRYRADIDRLLPEIDGFVGPGCIRRLPEAVRNVWQGKRVRFLSGTHTLAKTNTPRLVLTPRHSVYVKIADGCDNRCHYCVIPAIRGPYRSRSLRSIEEEVRRLLNNGASEINLISQDTTYYGKDRYGGYALERLLRRLVRLSPGPRWIRVLYTHPRHVRPELLDMIRDEPRICNYIDMPIQHVHTQILSRMGRAMTGHQVRACIDHIRERAPGVALRTTLIAGFPGESERIFSELAAFVRQVCFERLGVFAYSAEEGTPAARLRGQIPVPVRRRRRARLMAIQRPIAAAVQRSRAGQELEVLIDEISGPGTAVGRTQFDAPEVVGMVLVRGKSLHTGDFCRVRISDSYHYDLAGDKV